MYTPWSRILEDERTLATWHGLPAQTTGGVGAMKNTWEIPSQPGPMVEPLHETHDMAHLPAWRLRATSWSRWYGTLLLYCNIPAFECTHWPCEEGDNPETPKGKYNKTPLPPTTTDPPWQRWLRRTNGRRSIPPTLHHRPKTEESTNGNLDPEWRGNHPNDVDGHTAQFYGPPVRKYDHIPSSAESIRQTLDCVLKKLPPIAANIREEPTTLDELRTAVATGKARKAPGCDGISLEFFKITWEVTKQDLLNIMNTKYSNGIITDTQKRGDIVCIPKTPHPLTPDEYRTLTIRNTDNKLLARLISNRMRP